ncbi:Protease 4 [Porphyromonas cangingivalis]|nr:Protease 4 [Porphyromonas cangingivalis]
MLLASCLGVVVAGIIVLFVFFSMLGGLVSSVSDAFGSKDTATTKAKKISSGSVLMLDLSGMINDTKTGDFYSDLPFGKGDKKQKNFPLHEIIKAINIATEDPKIEAIVLKLERAGMGFATAQELREHLDNFRKSGKEIFAYAERYGYGNYYVSSVADKVYLNPYGMINISGLSSTTLFYSGILKKLGVEMQVFKVGTFKGAVEPYINSKLSDANKMQIQTYLDGLWSSTKADIAQSRNIHPDSIQAFADRGDCSTLLKRLFAFSLWTRSSMAQTSMRSSLRTSWGTEKRRLTTSLWEMCLHLQGRVSERWGMSLSSLPKVPSWTRILSMCHSQP